MTPDPDLSAAYALDGPEGCRRLYAAWADSYDADFAAGMDYQLPARVAAAYLAAGGAGPVLDAGAGTGLVGAALRALGFAGAIDGADLSPAMLARAQTLGVYRTLFEADLTQPLPFSGPWAGVVSAGTFTHGHLGPEALAHLAAAAPGALFALSVNAGIWAARGFAAALAALGVRGLDMAEVPIYGPAAAARDPAHAADRALIVTFRAPGP